MKSILFVRKTWLVLIMVLSTAVLSACGGGGSSDSTIRYTGITEKAVITEQNAVTLTLGAYFGGPVVVAIPIGMNSLAEEPALSSIQTDALPYSWPSSGMFKDFTAYLATALQIQPQTVQTESEVISGSCGGRATITININDSNGSFNGTIRSDNYCENDVTIAGMISFSGEIDLMTLELTELRTLSNYLIKDNNTGKVYKIENINMLEEAFTDRVKVRVDGGRYYHPDYGYVTPETNQPFEQYLVDAMPSSGEFTISGALQTQAKLTIHNVNDVEITADTDGDGVFEWSSGNLN